MSVIAFFFALGAIGLFAGVQGTIAKLTARVAELERRIQVLDHAVYGAPEDGEPPPGMPATPPEGLDEVTRLAHSGRKIEAIKRYREITGCGLAEAKQYVDNL